MKIAGSAQRSAWTGKWGFIFATAASAIGLGNLWRFPYLAAKYGGGAFLLVYIILVVTFGYALMMAESALGRKTGLSTIGAFSSFGKKYAIIGILASVVPFIITPYYCLIGAWVTKYMVSYLTEPASVIADPTYFSSFILQNNETFLWLLLFVLLVVLVIALGVQKGIERVSKVLVIALFVLAIVITGYSLTLPGAMDGLAYFLIPDFSKFSLNLVVAAMGQMFFSLSLAMGIMVTYGSYFKKSEDLEQSVRYIEVFDTLIAFLAGTMIIPAAFAVSGSADAVSAKAGPSLMFGALPQVFQNLGGAGNVIGFIFFALVFAAALTSAISLFEACVSIIADAFHVTRRRAIVAVTVVIGALGVLVDAGYNGLLNVDLMYSLFGIGNYGDDQLLDFFDFVSNTILMPVVSLLTCLFVGYVIKPKTIIDEVEQSSEFKGKKLFVVMTKYIAPVFVVTILVSYVLNTMGIISL
jgi:NSS family neurotransmitter:Na+ symporter